MKRSLKCAKDTLQLSQSYDTFINWDMGWAEFNDLGHGVCCGFGDFHSLWFLTLRLCDFAISDFVTLCVTLTDFQSYVSRVSIGDDDLPYKHLATAATHSLYLRRQPFSRRGLDTGASRHLLVTRAQETAVESRECRVVALRRPRQADWGGEDVHSGTTRLWRGNWTRSHLCTLNSQ